jgi:hypothetical protein
MCDLKLLGGRMDAKQTLDTLGVQKPDQKIDVHVLPLSGEFLSLAQAGEFDTHLQLLRQQEKLHEELARARVALNQCNNRQFLWRLLSRYRQAFPEQLRNLAKERQAQLSDLEAKLMAVTDALSVSMPLTAKSLTMSTLTTRGEDFSLRRPTRRDPFVAAREVVIRGCRGQPHRRVCQRLDLEFAGRDGLPPPELPERWVGKFDVRSFVAAYDNSACRNRVAKMISTARRRSPLAQD